MNSWGRRIASIALQLHRRTGDHHIFLLAGGLTFSVFTCIVPLCLIVIAVLGNVLETEAVRLQTSSFIQTLVPVQGQSAVEGFILSRMKEFVDQRETFGTLGILGLLFTATGLFNSVRTILHVVYQIEAKQTELIDRARDFATVVIVLLLFLCVSVAVPLLEAVTSSSLANRFSLIERLGGPAYDLTGLLAMFAALFGIYALVPYGKRGITRAAFSAVAAMVLWQMAIQLFRFYVGHTDSMERTYGGYILLMLPALWIYCSCIVLIVGAEIGQLALERK